jgi:phage host-nuclease inhibitor protein Gam
MIGAGLDEVDAIIAKREKRRLKLTSELATLDQEEAAELAPKIAHLKSCCSKVRTFAERNRGTLTNSKTVTFPSGNMLQWNELAPQVDKIDHERYFDEVKAHDLASLFIKVEESPDRQALLRNRDQADLLESVSFKRREIFRIKPARRTKRMEADVGKPDWKIAETKKKS